MTTSNEPNNGAGMTEFGLVVGGEDVEHNGLGFLDMSNICGG